MQELKIYEIPLNDGDIEDLEKIKEAIEDNSHLFDDFILSRYGGDARYSVFDDSFSVSSISDDFFVINVQVQFYAGCSDQNGLDDVEECIKYENVGDVLTFELDETVWHQE